MTTEGKGKGKGKRGIRAGMTTEEGRALRQASGCCIQDGRAVRLVGCGGWSLQRLRSSWRRGARVAVLGAFGAAVGVVAVAQSADGPAAMAKQAKPVVMVAAGGSGAGKFATVQAAVDAAPVQGEVIRIAPGVYREKISIAKNGIELRGMGAKPEGVVLSWYDSAGSAGGTSKSWSVSVTGDDFFAENLTVENLWEQTHSRTHEGAQAVALMITGDREVLRQVRLLGYQDTLYANSKTCHASTDPIDKACRASRMLFQDCYIAGHVDFIFGDAKAVFDHCEIHAMAHPEVTITAQSRLYPLENSGYLFLDCTITAEPGISELLLGRPWRAYSTVFFVNTKVDGTKLAAPGWAEWAGKLASSKYGEYGTVDVEKDGAGKPEDTSGRIAGTVQLTAEEAKLLTVKNWLRGPDGWDAEAVR
jgi:pectinesterase